MTAYFLAELACTVAFLGAMIVAAYALLELACRWEHRSRDPHSIEHRYGKWS